MNQDAPQRIELLGRQHAVTLPSFADREALLEEYGRAYSKRERVAYPLVHVYAAALGLCTRVGRMAKIEFADHRFDVLAYGRAVYGWLREQGATHEQVAVGLTCVLAVHAAVFPTEDEVAEAAGNSEGDEERQTASP